MSEKMNEIISNMPTSFTDRARIACRTDGTILLSMLSEIPDAVIENHRTAMSISTAKKISKAIRETIEKYEEGLQEIDGGELEE
jgi:hypothetical protein